MICMKLTSIPYAGLPGLRPLDCMIHVSVILGPGQEFPAKFTVLLWCV